MDLDTTKWPTLGDLRLRRNKGVSISTRSHALVLRIGGGTMPVVPKAVSDVLRSCDGCIADSTGGQAVNCHELPDCSGHIYLEATPENLAEYVASRMDV